MILNRLLQIVFLKIVLLISIGCDSGSSSNIVYDNKPNHEVAVPKPVDGDIEGSSEFPPSPPQI